jgi:hypothetical protein
MQVILSSFLMDNNVGDDNEVIVVLMASLVGLVSFFWLCGLLARFIYRRMQKPS